MQLLLRCDCKCVGAEFSRNMLPVVCINCQALITCFANESLQSLSLSATPDSGSGPIRCEQSFLPFSECPVQLPHDLSRSQMAYLAICQWFAAVSSWDRCMNSVGKKSLLLMSFKVLSITCVVLKIMEVKCDFLFCAFYLTCQF